MTNTYKVVQTIRGTWGADTEVSYYTGPDLAVAVAAAAQAATGGNDTYYTIISVRIDFL